MLKRLYVSGSGDKFRFVTASTIKAARKRIGVNAHTASDEECREVWLRGRLYEMTSKELQKKFQVTRQAVANWRQRGGADLPTCAEHQLKRKLEALHMALVEMKHPSANELAEVAHTSPHLAHEMAKRLGIVLRGHRRMPSDEELVELQRDCTWQELAAKTGMRLSTLRNYIYKKPELSKALKAVRKPALSGPAAHGTFPREKVRELYLSGLNAHQISESLLLEQMTVRYWINKWRQEAEANEENSDGRAAGGPVGGSDEGDQREQR